MSGTQDPVHAQAPHAHAAHDQATHAAQGHDAHEGPIKTPKQLAVAVFFAFLIPIVVIIMLANFVSSQVKPGEGSTGLDEQAVASRLQPVGTVDFKDLSNPAAMKTGEQVFQAQCAACHGAGVAGAPKLADAAAWAPRIQSGYDTLLHSALKGKGNMGPQGGGDFSDFEIARAVVYLANQGGAKFKEPVMPAAGAASGAAAASGATAGASAAANAGAAPAATAASAP